MSPSLAVTEGAGVVHLHRPTYCTRYRATLHPREGLRHEEARAIGVAGGAGWAAPDIDRTRPQPVRELGPIRVHQGPTVGVGEEDLAFFIGVGLDHLRVVGVLVRALRRREHHISVLVKAVAGHEEVDLTVEVDVGREGGHLAVVVEGQGGDGGAVVK